MADIDTVFHVYTPEAAAAIEAWWPENTYTTKKSWLGGQFQRDMRNMQRDLIRCHIRTMTAEERTRAARTLSHLAMIDSGVGGYW